MECCLSTFPVGKTPWKLHVHVSDTNSTSTMIHLTVTMLCASLPTPTHTPSHTHTHVKNALISVECCLSTFPVGKTPWKLHVHVSDTNSTSTMIHLTVTMLCASLPTPTHTPSHTHTITHMHPHTHTHTLPHTAAYEPPPDILFVPPIERTTLTQENSRFFSQHHDIKIRIAPEYWPPKTLPAI